MGHWVSNIAVRLPLIRTYWYENISPIRTVWFINYNAASFSEPSLFIRQVFSARVCSAACSPSHHPHIETLHQPSSLHGDSLHSNWLQLLHTYITCVLLGEQEVSSSIWSHANMVSRVCRWIPNRLSITHTRAHFLSLCTYRALFIFQFLTSGFIPACLPTVLDMIHH